MAKPAETTLLTTLRIAGIMREHGLPEGVFQVVTGKGSVVGEALVTDARVAKVAFTGSTPVGKHVGMVAARGVKRVTLELGGSDPMIVLDDADVDAAVSAASVGRFFNCGQACLAIKRLYLHEAIADEFVEKLASKVARLTVGAGTADGTTIGPLHSEAQRATLDDQIDSTLARAAASCCRRRPAGRRRVRERLVLRADADPRAAAPRSSPPRRSSGRRFDLAHPRSRRRDRTGECERVRTRVVDLDTRPDGGDRRCREARSGLHVDQLEPDHLRRASFGGFGESGVGKEHGIEALDYYQEAKAVVVKQSPR